MAHYISMLTKQLQQGTTVQHSETSNEYGKQSTTPMGDVWLTLDAHPEMSRYCKRYMAQKSKKRPHHQYWWRHLWNSNQHDYDVCDGEREGEDDEYWTELDVLEELEGMALPGSNTGAHATRAPRSKRKAFKSL